jgi:hypothetical protein
LLRAASGPGEPAQVIAFELAEAASIRLAVFDIRGRVIRSWGPEFRGAGSHVVTWDASGIPAGVYFYRLQTPTAEARAKQVVTIR